MLFYSKCYELMGINSYSKKFFNLLNIPLLFYLAICEINILNKRLYANIKQVDEHEMIFESSYKDWYIIEHTRLVDSDNYRFRVIYSWNKNKLIIVENHHEIKIIK